MACCHFQEEGETFYGFRSAGWASRAVLSASAMAARISAMLRVIEPLAMQAGDAECSALKASEASSAVSSAWRMVHDAASKTAIQPFLSGSISGPVPASVGDELALVAAFGRRERSVLSKVTTSGHGLLGF